MPAARIASGRTTPGKGWVVDPHHEDHIYIDVDTSAAGFTTTPVYLCSIGGTEWHCYTLGGNSVYNPTQKGFRVYLAWARGAAKVNRWNINNLTGRSNDRAWHVKWIGIEGRGSGSS